MIKKFILLSLSLIFVLLSCLSVLAQIPTTTKVWDSEGLLTYEQKTQLEEALDKLSEEYGCFVTIATTPQLTNYQAEKDAEAIYNNLYKAENEDGIILLVSLSNRKYGIYTSGKAEKIFKSDTLDELEETIKPYLSENDVFGAFSSFTKVCDEALDYYFNIKVKPSWIFVSLGIGVGISFIIVLVMKSQLKSVRYQSAANSYLKNGSLNVTESREIFLFSTIKRTPKPQQKSSSGSSGGGRSGSF